MQKDARDVRVIDWPRPSLDEWPVHSDYAVDGPRGSETIRATGPIVRRYNVSAEDRLLFNFLHNGGEGFNPSHYLKFVSRFGLGGFTQVIGSGGEQGWSEQLNDWRQAYGHLRFLHFAVALEDPSRRFESNPLMSRATRSNEFAALEAAKLHDASVFLGEYLRLEPTREANGLRRVERRPIGLIGVLWLQAIRHYTNDLDWRICVGCQEPMAIGRDLTGKRQDAQFCSRECRTRFTNRWRGQAVRLRREGYAVRAIAQELGIEATRVKEWLATAKRQSQRVRNRRSKED